MNENPAAPKGIVGIDVSKLKFDIYAVDSPRTSGKSKVFSNTSAGRHELQEWLLKRGFVEGHMASPGHFAIERAFVEK